MIVKKCLYLIILQILFELYLASLLLKSKQALTVGGKKTKLPRIEFDELSLVGHELIRYY